MMASRNQSGSGLKPKEYTITEGDSRDEMFYLRHQWGHYFGGDCDPGHLPHLLADVMGWVDEEDRPLGVCTPVARHEDVLIGGGVAAIYDREQTVNELPPGRFDAESLAGDRNAWLLFGVVDPAWRGHGIGNGLFQYRLQWARARGVDMVFSYGWERDGPSSKSLFEGHGFVPIQRFEDYYASKHSGRSACPDCGVWDSDDKKCQCSCTLWAIDGDDL